jgi:ABC-type bacteriocin/lantibiotic exporter with double-glycine peptidase domain
LASLSVAKIKPVLDLAEPILKAEPEKTLRKDIATRISGGIEMNGVYFRYNEQAPYILENFSVKIKAGEYVAIVGKTGCGKSTLVRLLLGFEKPEKGAVFYDGKDLERIDLKSLRRKIGSVIQDGKLFYGDIFHNIAIASEKLTQEEAWEAAELAGIADDIEAMPMGMHTIIAEGQGGISGGQKQRILIARAVASRPKILIFDEATSALDNITQRQISEALDGLKCTRIVIAHRLSTIKNCDRILVMDGGKIVEQGTYDELIANKGYFSELVERQQL